VLASRHSHNGGTDKFFSGLAAILSGQSENLRQVRPKFIALYKLANESIKPTDSWRVLSAVEDGNHNMLNVTQLIPLESRVVAMDNTSADLQLKIPFTYITDPTIHMFALFPESIADGNTNNNNPAADSLEQAIAYFKLIENGEWAPIKIDRTALQNSLVIDWSLAFSDKGE
jgi:hypothetical protein